MSFRSRRSDVAIPQAVIASEQSEHGNLLDSIEYVMEHMKGKTCFEEFDSNYSAKMKILQDSREFLNREGMPICEIEDSKETYSELDEFIQENELDAFILCYFEK